MITFEQFFLLVFIIPSIMNADQFYLKRDHSLFKPYQGSGMTIPNWDFAGSTIVTNSFIRLTPDEQSRSGSLWNKVPLYLRNWEVHVEFRVSGKGKDLFGDGLAFWYARDPLRLGPVFGNEEVFWGLGIFLDTYANQYAAHSHSHPYISAMVNNGTLKYDHDRDGTHTELAGCEAKFRGREHDTHLLIRYEGNTLSVQTDVEGTGEWKSCFSVSGVELPTGLHLGFSATTGELSDNHDIIAIRTYELEAGDTSNSGDRSQIVPSAAVHAPHRDHVQDTPPRTSGLKIIFYVIFSIIGLAALVGAGLFFYQQKGAKKNRFY